MDGKYEALRLKNQLCFPLYVCSRELTRRYQPLLEAINLTYTQYVVMMYFWEKGSASLKDVSRALLLDPSTLTPVLKKLEAKGFLSRARDPQDERSLAITLTEEGRRLQDEALAIPGKIGGCVGLSEDEAVQLGKLIEKVLNNIEKEL